MIPWQLGVQQNGAMYSNAHAWMQTFDCCCSCDACQGFMNVQPLFKRHCIRNNLLQHVPKFSVTAEPKRCIATLLTTFVFVSVLSDKCAAHLKAIVDFDQSPLIVCFLSVAGRASFSAASIAACVTLL